MFRKAILLAATVAAGLVQAQDDNLLIGAGMFDVTGPAAEAGMLGYASLSQKTAGIHTRLHARAFIFAEADRPLQRVVLVSADLGMIVQSVKQGVVNALQQKYGDLYRHENVMLAPTHTHGGPGGLSHYALTNLTSLGFIKQNYRTVVDGIVKAIEQAHDELGEGDLYINQGNLYNAGVNRSAPAYANNPADEQAQYLENVNRTMTSLKLSKNDQDYAAWNWFAVHPVSMSNKNKLISSDNQGHASYLFEKQMGRDYLNRNGFIAAFAQSNSGDISPNLNLDGTGPGNNEFESTRLIGQRQYQKAKELHDYATLALKGDIDFRHTFINMHQIEVSEEYTGEANATTCPAALGYAMAAGTEDGRGPTIFREGYNRENPLFTVLTSLIGVATSELRECQAEKEILLATGVVSPIPWTPDVLPVQLLKIGRLAVVAVPSEVTTMAGRRLKNTVKRALGEQVDYVEVTGIANTYAGYVTTREEYAMQNYEGGHTMYGPHTLGAYQQEFANLANAMANNQPVPAGESLRELGDQQLELQTGVVLDNTPIFKRFGDVHEQPKYDYSRGQTAEASFWTGHPKNDLKLQSSYLEIQKKVGWHWYTIATDNDWETIYRWKRVDPFWGTSRAEISWTIPDDAKQGVYRIKHNGAYKNGWNGRVYSFTGYSRSFKVR